MYRKIIIQFLLLSLLLGIIIFTFFSYFHKKENLEQTNVYSKTDISAKIDDETGTLIENIYYVFSDHKGNNYEITSEFGKVDIEDSDKIFMTNVTAIIYLINSLPVTITSKYANYNKNNHETNFFENVKLIYVEHEATSENLDLLFKDNLASMYNNIVYKKPGTKLTADILNIDLVTKNSKIFMENKYEKIKIIEKKKYGYNKKIQNQII